MQSYLIGSEEEARSRALAENNLIGSPNDPSFTHLVELARRLFNVPVACLSLIDEEKKHLHATAGAALSQVDRQLSFCDHTIRQKEPLVVLDALRDPRFYDNSSVTGASHVRFYAGVPLRLAAGHAIGAFCLTDTKPRSSFSEADQWTLQALAGLVLDRMELHRLEVSNFEGRSRFEQIAGTSPDGIVCANQHGRITFWNGAAERLFGYTAKEAIGESIDLIVPERMRGGHSGGLHRVSSGGASRLVGTTVELSARHKDGSEFPIELSLSMWRENGQSAFGSIVRDIRDRRANEERLFRLAHLDPLTELPNRTVLRNRIKDILDKSQPMTLLMLDLDGFKDVNDGLGHAAGDVVLKRAAERLLTCVSAVDTVSRLGGDEFAIVLYDVADPCRAVETAQSIIQALAEPFIINEQVLSLGVSVGIAISPSHGETPEELLSYADMALYQAKAEGRRRYRLFTPELRLAAHRERASQEALHRAVKNGEFVLFYQPQVRLCDGALVGAEALIRWQHPEHGLLTPAAFLATLDASPYAAEVGNWVLRTACAQTAAWRALGALNFRMGVNLCSAQFRQGNLVESVRLALFESKIPASCLELEITENIILQHDTHLVETLRDLHGTGIGIAFDDYGTGYASLSLLKKFPLTRLKIDQSFVRAICECPQDAAIVRAVLDLSKSFGLEVIAEGVETIEQQQRLLGKGCQEAQGYLFGRPMPPSIFARTFGFIAPASDEHFTSVA